MDFRLGPDTVRNPDVAFMTQEHLSQTDIDRSPVEGAPVLAVEVVSPANRAEDMVKKTRQYLEAGARSVWIVYPKVRLSEIHSTKNVRTVQEPETLRDDALLPNLSMSLPYIFDGAQDRS
jgi:Uma2 family endonuclease